MSKRFSSNTKWIIIIPIVAMVILATILTNIIKSGVEEVVSENDAMQEQYVGSKVVLEGDTLSIIDCSLLLDQCTLSNGIKVSTTFIDKNKIEDE